MCKIKYISFTFVIAMFMLSCNRSKNPNGKAEETILTGSIKILVDETIKPIVEDQLYIFKSSYPDAEIELVFKPENELLNLFLSDSIRVGIMSRELTTKEEKFYTSKQIRIRKNRFAIDGIALITHNSNSDSTVTVQELIDIMNGKSSKFKSFVFDNPNSSTVRYFKELANVANLPKSGVYGLKSSIDVIKYVHDNPRSVGVVGINWIQEPPADLEKTIDDIRVMGVKNLVNKPGSDAFYKPSQSNLALGLYPLTRNLYIINCQGRAGLGTGFASFIAGERGQRIVLKSGLLPDSIPSREIIIRK